MHLESIADLLQTSILRFIECGSFSEKSATDRLAVQEL
jgi:hypothetical protein